MPPNLLSGDDGKQLADYVATSQGSAGRRCPRDARPRHRRERLPRRLRLRSCAGAATTSRRSSGAQAPSPRARGPSRGDLTDGPALARRSPPSDRSASSTSPPRSPPSAIPSAIQAVNVDGTRRLLEACRAAGEPRVRLRLDGRDRRGRRRAARRGHAAASADGSTAAPAGGRGDAARVRSARRVVIRPSHVYGARRLVRGGVRQAPAPTGAVRGHRRGENLWTWSGSRTSRAPWPTPRSARPPAAFHVADDEPISFYDFIALTAKALGVGAPRRVPARLAALVGGRGRDHGGGALGARRRTRASSASWAGRRAGRPRARACPTPSRKLAARV